MHEENLTQPLQTKSQQYKVAVTFLAGYNGIFNVTNKIRKLIFKSVIEGAQYDVITIPRRTYELQSLEEESKRNIIEEKYITEEEYPF